LKNAVHLTANIRKNRQASRSLKDQIIRYSSKIIVD